MVGEQAADALGEPPLGLQQALHRAVGDQPAGPGHRARAALEPLRALHLAARCSRMPRNIRPTISSAVARRRRRGRARRPRGRARAAASAVPCERGERLVGRAARACPAGTPRRRRCAARRRRRAVAARTCRRAMHVEHQRGVGDRAGQRAEADPVVASRSCGARGTRPLCGLRPNSPQQAAGMRIEPAPSAASAAGDEPGGDRGRRAAARAAGRAVGVPRVARHAPGDRLGERPQPELGHRRLADDDRARRRAAAYDLGVGGRRVVTIAPVPRLVTSPADVHLVLDGDRHARAAAVSPAARRRSAWSASVSARSA